MWKIENLGGKERAGAVGIGAMIVFIAMVLVAGIAAGVLFQTSSSLQTQAMKSGGESISAVANGLKVESVIGYQKSDSVTLLSIEIRTMAGSSDVDLSKAILELSDVNQKKIFTYGGKLTAANDVNGDIFNTSFYPDNTTSTKFYIIVLQDEDGSCKQNTPIINQRDHVLLAVNTTAAFGGIPPRTKMFGKVMIGEGFPGVLSFTTPASYTTSVMRLL